MTEVAPVALQSRKQHGTGRATLRLAEHAVNVPL